MQPGQDGFGARHLLRQQQVLRQGVLQGEDTSEALHRVHGA